MRQVPNGCPLRAGCPQVIDARSQACEAFRRARARRVRRRWSGSATYGCQEPGGRAGRDDPFRSLCAEGDGSRSLGARLGSGHLVEGPQTGGCKGRPLYEGLATRLSADRDLYRVKLAVTST